MRLNNETKSSRIWIKFIMIMVYYYIWFAATWKYVFSLYAGITTKKKKRRKKRKKKRFQWGLNSGACLRIPELGFHWGVLLFEYAKLFSTRDVAVLVNTIYMIGCCDLMLMQPWTKVMYCSLLWVTWQIRAGISISHLSTSGIVVHGRSYVCHCFFIFFFRALFYVVFRVVLITFHKRSFFLLIHLTSFLVPGERLVSFIFDCVMYTYTYDLWKTKVSFFSNHCHSFFFNHCYSFFSNHCHSFCY